jgi:alpha-beta hydrolase superfamily lysophospholipase
MKVWKVAALAAPVLAVGALCSTLIWYSRKWIVSPRVVFDSPHDDHVEVARFGSADGVALQGWLMLGELGRPAIILCHGYQRSMEEPFSLAVELRHRGFTVMLFDFRGCGRSGGSYTTIGHDEPADLVAAARWLRHRLGPDVPIGVLGISMGGAVAIEGAARVPDIAAVVTDSAFAHLSGAMEHRFSALRGFNLHAHRVTMRIAERMCRGRVSAVRPVDAIERIAPRPILLIHGSRDGIVPLSHLDELYAAAGEPKDRWVVQGTTHAMARMDQPVEYVSRVATFFDKALTEPAIEPAPEPARRLS